MRTLEHRIEAAERLVVISGASAPAVASARESVGRLADDPNVGKGFGVLILVASDAPPPSGVDILVMSGLLTALTHSVDGPVAIVTPGAAQSAPASMMALAGDPPHRVQSFTSEHDARIWLRTQLGP